MNVVALISGGKDSCFNMMHCVANGHTIVALANLHPPLDSGKDELDSHMFQTIGHDLIPYFSSCLDLPLFRRELKGGSVVQSMDYTREEGDEVEDLVAVLEEVKRQIPSVNAVSVGAILSNYQRIRVEHVCSRLGLTCLSYLWRQDQDLLLREMVAFGVDSRVVKVAAMGLKPSHLGKPISAILGLMRDLNNKFGSQICGEGGEYETLTVDCPLFHRRIVLDSTAVLHGEDDDGIAPVAHLKVLQAHLEEKREEEVGMGEEMKEGLRSVFERRGVEVDPSELASLSQQAQQQPESTILASSNPSTTTNQTNEPTIRTSEPFTFITTLLPTIHGTIREETTSLLNLATSLLSSRNASWQDVVHTRCFLLSISDFAEFNSLYSKNFAKNPASRVTLSTSLPGEFKVGIELIVADKDQGKWKRENMHVQSISYWAPANIGPYSQSYTINNTIFVAGQIGLVPHTMTLPATLAQQLSISLANLDAVVTASSGSLDNAVYLICYLVCPEDLAWAKGYMDKVFRGRVPWLGVMVKGLPRFAKVEWEVLVAKEKEGGGEDDDDDDGPRGSIGRESSADVVEDTFPISTPSSSVSTGLLLKATATTRNGQFGCTASLSGNLSIDDSQAVFDEILSLLKTFLERLGSGTWKRVVSCRVFADKRLPTGGLKSAWTTFHNGQQDPAISFMATESSPQWALAICLHGYLDR